MVAISTAPVGGRTISQQQRALLAKSNAAPAQIVGCLVSVRNKLIFLSVRLGTVSFSEQFGGTFRPEARVKSFKFNEERGKKELWMGSSVRPQGQ